MRTTALNPLPFLGDEIKNRAASEHNSRGNYVSNIFVHIRSTLLVSTFFLSQNVRTYIPAESGRVYLERAAIRNRNSKKYGIRQGIITVSGIGYRSLGIIVPGGRDAPPSLPVFEFRTSFLVRAHFPQRYADQILVIITCESLFLRYYTHTCTM